MREEQRSDKLQKQIQEFLKSPFQKNEEVMVRDGAVSKWCSDENRFQTKGEIIAYDEKEELYIVRVLNGRKYENVKVKFEDIERPTYKVGANPFSRYPSRIKMVNFTLDSILSAVYYRDKENSRNYKIEGIPVKECSFNPYVYDKNGKKRYYQRALVWTLQDKQNLIESIYMNNSCGLVVVRYWNGAIWKRRQRMEKPNLLFWIWLMESKDFPQLLNLLKISFQINMENYFGDLSDEARRRITDHQLISYGEMHRVSDKDTIAQFLKINIAGVPQSEEHMNTVMNILKEI
jgi:hypothetical protein